MVSKVLGTKWADLTGDGKRLHNVGLHFLYSAPNIVRVVKSRRTRRSGHVARMSESRGADRVSVRTPDGKRQFVSPSRRWEDNIEVDL